MTTETKFDWGSDEFLFERQLQCLAAKNVDSKARTIDVTLNTPALDHDGERVLPKAFEETIGLFDEKAGHPVFFNHIRSGIPLGRVIPESRVITAERFDGTIKFRDAGRDPDADKVWDAVEDGLLTDVSVGFKVHETVRAKNADGTEGPLTITKATLMELSIVNIGSNPEAVIRKDTTLDRVKSALELPRWLGPSSTEVAHEQAAQQKPDPVVYVHPTLRDVYERTVWAIERLQDRQARKEAIEEWELLAVAQLKQIVAAFTVTQPTEEVDDDNELVQASKDVDEAIEALKAL